MPHICERQVGGVPTPPAATRATLATRNLVVHDACNIVLQKRRPIVNYGRVALDFLQLFTGLNLRVGFVCGAVVASVMQGVDALAR